MPAPILITGRVSLAEDLSFYPTNGREGMEPIVLKYGYF